MAPKRAVLGAGYATDQMTNEMVELIERLENMSVEDLSNLQTQYDAELATIQMKMNLPKDRRSQIEYDNPAIAAKAKARAKSEANARALELKREGSTTISAMTMPAGTVVQSVINKNKTVGKARSRIIKLSGSFPLVGKKNGMLKRDILIIDVNGKVLGDRLFIYNTSSITKPDEMNKVVMTMTQKRSPSLSFQMVMLLMRLQSPMMMLTLLVRKTDFWS
ncbi:unnamed protein product [Effrenium voratum]|uniref:Uncharacterized protein n=1 Tax=Effrenium voratum TaxID=2562239 RepID=A0AA36N3Q2_9DINO|nr:unnamed protein product [Effrenium voratum]